MNTPELDKMRVARETSQTIGDFIEWLSENKMEICKIEERYEGEAEYLPVYDSIERILAKYFKIDLDKVEEERLAILEELRG